MLGRVKQTFDKIITFQLYIIRRLFALYGRIGPLAISFIHVDAG
jgi:hypothetical protein